MFVPRVLLLLGEVGGGPFAVGVEVEFRGGLRGQGEDA